MIVRKDKMEQTDENRQMLRQQKCYFLNTCQNVLQQVQFFANCTK